MRRVLFQFYAALLLAMVPATFVFAAFDDAAFEEGSGQPGSELRLALAMIIVTISLLWTSWLFVGVYTGWRDGSLDWGAAMFTMLRALLVVAVIGAFIR